MEYTKNVGISICGRKRIKNIDIVIIMALILSYFSYTSLFDENSYFKFLWWTLLGVIAAMGVYANFRFNIHKDYSAIAFSKIIFVLVFLVGGISGGHVYSAFAKAYMLLIIFVVHELLIKKEGWYDKCLKIMFVCSLVYVSTAVIQLFSTSFITMISQLLLPNDYMDYYRLLISNHYYVGIATQASYQVHYILPLSAISISLYLIGNNERGKKIGIVMFGLSFFGMVISQKRMPLVAIAICTVICFLLSPQTRKQMNRKLVFIIGFIAIAIPVLSSTVGERVMSRFGGNIVTDNVRMEMWSQALHLLNIRNVFIGAGVGSVSDKVGLSAHNSFVQVLTENGIVGLACYLVFTVVPIIYTVKLIKRIRKGGLYIPKYNEMMIVLMSSLFVQVFCLIHSCTESVFSNDVMFFPLQIFVAMSYSVEKNMDIILSRSFNR